MRRLSALCGHARACLHDGARGHDLHGRRVHGCGRRLPKLRKLERYCDRVAPYYGTGLGVVTIAEVPGRLCGAVTMGTSRTIISISTCTARRSNMDSFSAT